MCDSGTFRRTVLRLVWLLTVIPVTACAEFEPYEPRNDRVEGPKQGLFSGEAGEFVIYKKSEEIESGDEENKNESSSD